MRGSAGSPDQRASCDTITIGEFDFVGVNGFYFSIRPNLDTTSGQLAAGVTTKLLSEFRENELTRVHKDHPNHFGFYGRVITKGAF